MADLHPDGAALDRLGFAPVRAHFNISRQAWHYWRRHGVPKLHRKTLVMLGDVRGVKLPEFEGERA